MSIVLKQVMKFGGDKLKKSYTQWSNLKFSNILVVHLFLPVDNIRSYHVSNDRDLNKVIPTDKNKRTNAGVDMWKLNQIYP